jgi:hypothetical protein
MGMWEGLYLGMQGIREREEREMDREEARRIREEDMAFRRDPSYAGILSIYGNDMVERVLGSGPRRLDPAQLSPSFTDLTSRQPITVVSPEQAQRFFELGVITETDTILYNGQQYPVRDLLEG